MTAAFITLLCALVLATAVILSQAKRISWLKEAAHELTEISKAYRKASEDQKPHFAIGVKLPGRKISVDRISFQNGRLYTSTLKVFDDKDDEFNFQQAEELLKALQD